jgi:two-component system, LuxR family, response regulator FixJ
MTDKKLVCLVDDDNAVLDALRLYLQTKGLEVRCFRSGESFLEGLGSGVAPVCLVTDVRMPGMSGLDLQQELRRRAVAFPIILITGHGEVAMAVAAIKAGALDFIEKPFDEQHLLSVIEEAIKETGRKLADSEEISAIDARIRELSDRQREVMQLAVQGYSNKEIAARLGISPRTVETYRAWVMQRTGARNLADLIRMVMRLEADRKI